MTMRQAATTSTAALLLALGAGCSGSDVTTEGLDQTTSSTAGSDSAASADAGSDLAADAAENAAAGTTSPNPSTLSEPVSKTEAAEAFSTVDFNNFSYTITDASDGLTEGLGSDAVEVVDGQYQSEPGPTPADPRLTLKVHETLFGDIGGDGQPEAVVRITYNTGGSATFSDAIVYGIDSGEPVRLGQVGTAVDSIQIVDTMLVTKAFGGDCETCQDYEIVTESQLGPNGLKQIRETQTDLTE